LRPRKSRSSGAVTARQFCDRRNRCRPIARAAGEWLVQWAAAAPDRTFLAERSGDDWRRVTYREALDAYVESAAHCWPAA
jgi:hypothetical protein